VNVIVIVSDTCRQDHLGCYGNEWMRTPSLDRLAAESAIFDNCHTGSFPTLPHRADCFLGRYGFPFYGWSPLPSDWPSLAEVLTGAGYVTQLIHDTPHLCSRNHYYNRGFMGQHWNRGQESDCEFTRANDEVDLGCGLEMDRYNDLRQAMNSALQRLDHPGELGHHSSRTALDVCRWLENNCEADGFFLWVDMFDPHEPWTAPEHFTNMYLDKEHHGQKVRHPNYAFTDYLTEDELKWSHAAYCGELTLVDKWIGVMLDKIADLGLLDDTAIFFTADHGFYLGEHGRIGKSSLGSAPWPLYREIIAEPLLVRLPDGPRGVHLDPLVQPVDLRPTILQLCGVSDDTPMHGKSFVRMLEGDDVRLREIAMSATRCHDREHPGSRVTVTHEDGWSLIIGTPEQEPELYNYIEDPGQQRNVLADNQVTALEIAAMFRAALSFIGASDDIVEQWKL